MIDQQGRLICSNQPTLESDDSEVKIYLNGNIYNHSARQLVDGFSSQGTNYISHLEGSFIIFLICRSHFYILTDKVNSRKAFYTSLDHTWYISNDIDALPKDKCQLSLDGIACYLANGFMLNDLTLFKEIRRTKRASVHSFELDGIKTEEYWGFKFTNPPFFKEQAQKYQQDFESVLVESVRKMLPAVSPTTTAISLSAGFDSRTILGILHERLAFPNLACFSYTLKDPPEMDSDAALAKQIAGLCSSPHQEVALYKGDLVSLLRNNAREGKCLSSFCEELDAWHQLAEKAQFTDIFVGDKPFGNVSIKSETRQEILGSIGIRDAAALMGLRAYLSRQTYEYLCHSINSTTRDVFDQTCAISDPLEKAHFLYLDQRTPNFILAWRENFTDLAANVHNPFFDGAVLEFFMHLPPNLRNGKFLYKKTVTNMFPGLFSVGISTAQARKVDWRRELLNRKDDLICLVRSSTSRLETVITKKELLRALQQHGSLIDLVNFHFVRFMNFFKRKRPIAEISQRFSGSRERSSSAPVQPERLLIRLLLLWLYLSNPSSEQGSSGK